MGFVTLNLFFLWNWVFKEISNVFSAAISIFHIRAVFIALMHVTRVLEDVNQKSILLSCPYPLESSVYSLVNWVHPVYHWHENNQATVSIPSVCTSVFASPLSWGWQRWFQQWWFFVQLHGIKSVTRNQILSSWQSFDTSTKWQSYFNLAAFLPPFCVKAKGSQEVKESFDEGNCMEVNRKKSICKTWCPCCISVTVVLDVEMMCFIPTHAPQMKYKRKLTSS